MSPVESERIHELLVRAGLGGLSPAALKGVLVAVVVVIGIGVWRFWPAAPTPEIACDDGTALVASGVATSGEDTAAAEIVVHVAGSVMNPGVYHLPLGGRVIDAVAAAGGALGSAATDAVNLARVLVDGEQVYLPSEEEVASGVAVGSNGATTGGSSASSAPGGLVNINTASASELDALPGVGPSTAQKIVDDREANGPFAKPEDLMRVPGIGQSKFDALKDLVTTS